MGKLDPQVLLEDQKHLALPYPQGSFLKLEKDTPK